MTTGTAPGTTTSGANAPVTTADTVTAHTLLNCLIREVSAPEHQVTVDDDGLDGGDGRGTGDRRGGGDRPGIGAAPPETGPTTVNHPPANRT